MAPVTRSKSARKLKKPIPPWSGPIPDPMLTEEAARYIRLPISGIYERTHPGAADPIPHIRLGRLLRFRQVDLDRWLAARKTAPKTKAVGR